MRNSTNEHFNNKTFSDAEYAPGCFSRENKIVNVIDAAIVASFLFLLVSINIIVINVY